MCVVWLVLVFRTKRINYVIYTHTSCRGKTTNTRNNKDIRSSSKSRNGRKKSLSTLLNFDRFILARSGGVEVRVDAQQGTLTSEDLKGKFVYDLPYGEYGNFSTVSQSNPKVDCTVHANKYLLRQEYPEQRAFSYMVCNGVTPYSTVYRKYGRPDHSNGNYGYKYNVQTSTLEKVFFK